MPGHSRWKNGVASLAYVLGIHVFATIARRKTWMAGTSPAMTNSALFMRRNAPCRHAANVPMVFGQRPSPVKRRAADAGDRLMAGLRRLMPAVLMTVALAS